ncbi:MAG: hypothetical protein ACM3O4_00220 [Ignavibacteriales bacterium]
MLFKDLLAKNNSQQRTLVTNEGQVISGKIKSNLNKIVELVKKQVEKFGQNHPGTTKRVLAGGMVLIMGVSGLTGCASKKENSFGLDRDKPASYVEAVADTMEDATKEGYMFYVDSKDEIAKYDFEDDVEMMLDTAYVVFNSEDIGKKELHNYGTDKITEDTILRNFERFGNYVKEHMMVASANDITDYSNLIEDETSAAAVEWFQDTIAKLNDATGKSKKVIADKLQAEIYLTFFKTSNAKCKEYEPAANLLILKMILGAHIRYVNNGEITILSADDEKLLFGEGPVDCSGKNVKVIGTSVYALQFTDLMENLEGKIKGADNIDKDSKELREEMTDDVLKEIKGLKPIVRDITGEINQARDEEFHNGNNAHADEPKLPNGKPNPNYVPPMTNADKNNLIEDPNHPGQYIIHEKPDKPVYEAPEEGSKTIITDPSATQTPSNGGNTTKGEVELLPGFYYDKNGVLRDPQGNEVIVDGNTTTNNSNTNNTQNNQSSQFNLLPGYYYDKNGVLRDKDGNIVILEKQPEPKSNTTTEDEVKLLPGFYYDKNGILRDPQGNEVILPKKTSSIDKVETQNIVATNNSAEIELLLNYKNALLASANTVEPEKGRML